MPSPTPSARPFGVTPTGEAVELWSLDGEGGLSAEILTYGGIVTRLVVPGRKGQPADVVLGFSTLEPYLARHPYFGAITGRIAGRVAEACLEFEGRTFPLPANEGPHHLHGGFNGLDRRVWKASPVRRDDGAPSLRLTYRSPDGEEGYPGNVDLAVTYTLTADNTFVIETEAQSDRPTPVSLTHHSYFNLEGEGSGDVTSHALQILAEESFEADDAMILCGTTSLVAGRGNDFTRPRSVGEALPSLHRRHGDLYWLRRAPADTPQPAARLYAPGGGRVLTVSTTDTCLQFYTGAFLDGSLSGKRGQPYSAHAGLCLECHGFPDSLRYPRFGDLLVRPGRPQRHETRYAFSVATEFPPMSR